ncbi:MAG: SMP-30/gluconolactonase/LRE family protein, partial [Phormidesmis sp.]
MSSLIPKVLVNCHYHHPEKPLWHSQHQSVYWTDIPNGRLFRCQPRFDGYEQIYLGEPVGGFTIQADGGLLLLKTNGTIERWNKGKVSTVVEEISDAKGARFNDAIADPEGRVFSGTMATEYSPGRFYRIDTNGSVHELFQNMRVPSGMGFSPDYKKFYLTDSEQRTIFSCDYDRVTGHLSNQYPLTIVRTEKGEKIVKKAIRAYGLVNTTKPTKMAMPAIIPGLLSKVGYLG